MANQRREQRDAHRTAVVNDRTVMVTVKNDEQITDDSIRARAHELYQRRGGEHGHDWEDWFEAERELRRAGDRRE